MQSTGELDILITRTGIAAGMVVSKNDGRSIAYQSFPKNRGRIDKTFIPGSDEMGSIMDKPIPPVQVKALEMLLLKICELRHEELRSL